MSFLTDKIRDLPPEVVHFLATRVFGMTLDALHHEWLAETAGECPCQRSSNTPGRHRRPHRQPARRRTAPTHGHAGQAQELPHRAGVQRRGASPVTAPDVAARVAAIEAAPITWPELVSRTEDTASGPDDWTWEWCVNCGSTDVTTRGLILEDGPVGALRRVAWCDRVSCDVDRAMTEYLATPRRGGGAS